ncbi:MAG: cysteine desulfurase family protein [Phototrophicaceae bacterium]
MSQRRSVYLDYSASTPTDPRVVDAMMPYFNDFFGNASSSHAFGRKAEDAIESARRKIAQYLNCKASEIVFTSGGSESDNLAIRGVALPIKHKAGANHLITTPIEHPAVGKTMSQLAEYMDFTLTHLKVDQQGLINPDDFRSIITAKTSLASIIYANNEVGTVQSLAELGTIARENDILLHTDAVQAAGQLSLDVQALNVDMLSISGHKFYGPKGVGALYVRDGIDLLPSQSGGSHEEGRRAGTHNTPFIVGLAKALELAYEEHDERIAKLDKLRKMLINGVLSAIPQASLTGHPEKRLPSHTSFVFDDLDANQLLIHLDIKGIAASSASACKTGNPEPSNVLLALGYSPKQASSSLRCTLSHHTSEDDIAYAIDAIAESCQALYKLKKVLTK